MRFTICILLCNACAEHAHRFNVLLAEANIHFGLSLQSVTDLYRYSELVTGFDSTQAKNTIVIYEYVYISDEMLNASLILCPFKYQHHFCTRATERFYYFSLNGCCARQLFSSKYIFVYE